MSILPGLLLSIAICILSLFIPYIGAPTAAILIGIALGNTLFTHSRFQAGTRFSEKWLLEISVALLGLQVSLQTLKDLGWKSLVFVLLMIASVIFFVLWLGKKLGLSEKQRKLMAIGNAVCGSSAIGALSPMIDGEEEKGSIITLVNLMGTVLMLTLPYLSLLVLSSPLARAGLIGSTLQSVGQVVGAASLLSADLVTTAMLFKLLRILSIIALLPLLSSHKTAQFRIPWYVLGFLLTLFIHFAWPKLPSFPTQYLEITALAAIGLRLHLKSFLAEGKTFLLYGSAVLAFQVVVGLILISLLGVA